MKNIKLNYMYRDGANYKQFGEIVFENPEEISIAAATHKIKEKLIQEMFFVSEDWGFPSLRIYPYDPEIDHDWHTFEDFEETNAVQSDSRSLGEFLEGIVMG
ncbi:hypothetical protein P872_10670 [Rhodonellum psychrophilum GCM71 = DSM 17998]|uniref:Uncharacterized protein n=3 Tax=Rhodonellum TaxID=336827 RepID=U5BU00_9BACT|nr:MULTISPECIES: hypothetical protein [Rhodonellum]ERM81338.1 hypothetical protein P872_10670 [Rhodonellum psychrophilum GCM71 = DSM 17998]SDY62270.1 hypothetical protein SAMN05444412_1029 [Rhodonellum ikkaensis]